VRKDGSIEDVEWILFEVTKKALAEIHIAVRRRPRRSGTGTTRFAPFTPPRGRLTRARGETGPFAPVRGLLPAGA
jgi:hypothetical protein